MTMTIHTRWMCLPLAAALFSSAWAQAPTGSTQGTAVAHTAESARAVIDRAAVVLPSRVTGGAVFTGMWKTRPAACKSAPRW